MRTCWESALAHSPLPPLFCRCLSAPFANRSYKAIITDRREVTSKYPRTSLLASRLRDRGVTDELAIDLIQKLLTLDPQQRIMADEAAKVSARRKQSRGPAQ